MAPLTDLTDILASLDVTPRGDYAYCVLPAVPDGAAPLATVAEEEGLTVVLPVEQAEGLGVPFDGVFTCITLGVHSALESVGLTAAVSAVLAEHSIPCNVIAGFHHDHLLVPASQADVALGLLRDLAANSRPRPGRSLAEGQAVRLRHWRLDDLDAYRDWLRPHQEWHQWDGPYFPTISAEAADAHVARIREVVEQGDGIVWPRTDGEPDRTLPVALAVVADASTDELVGTVSWHWESRETDWARMGISIYQPGLRGAGRGTEALRLWTDYLFRASAWRRLDYSTWSGNTAMVRVGEKLGFTMEGRFREARVVRGEVFDSVVLGVLRSEWEG